MRHANHCGPRIRIADLPLIGTVDIPQRPRRLDRSRNSGQLLGSLSRVQPDLRPVFILLVGPVGEGIHVGDVERRALHHNELVVHL